MRCFKIFHAAALLVVLVSWSSMANADDRNVVHDETTGTIVRSSSGECVRTRWMTESDPCGTAMQSAAAAPMPQVRYEQQRTVTLTREDRTVYFGFNQAGLSPEMQQRLGTIASTYRSDSSVKDARIVGYADRIGNPSYNEKLSEKRAENVRQYLVSQGLINTQVADTRWMGESDPVTSCPGNLKRSELISCLQKDRRVEVEIDYTNNVQASK